MKNSITAPPSAPVGVEGDGDGELSPEDLAYGRGYSAGRKDAKSDALVQQPAAVDEVCRGTHCCPSCGRCDNCGKPVRECLAAQQQGGGK